MFQLTQNEWDILRSQIATANLKSQFATSSWGGRRKLPYVFTEHGVLMFIAQPPKTKRIGFCTN
ncbi:MAG: ORF6N domain-containing protein [Treponema sp.]|nr:ORF6N domain-containing protein [Treponema sp.]